MELIQICRPPDDAMSSVDFVGDGIFCPRDKTISFCVVVLVAPQHRQPHRRNVTHIADGVQRRFAEFGNAACPRVDFIIAQSESDHVHFEFQPTFIH